MDTDWSIVSQSWFWDEDAIFKKSCSGSEWSREEEKAFENALAIHYNDADLWEKIALAVPGKTVADTKLLFEALRDDVAAIESGKVPLPHYPSKVKVRRNRKKTPVAARRRGKPWTEDEHRLFLQGLEMFGKGDWKRISRYSVCSRSNSQVASHAQKYYKRLMASKGKRSSINDIRSVEPEGQVALEKPTTSQMPKPTKEKRTGVKNHKAPPQNPMKALTYNENQVLPAYPEEISTDTVNRLFSDYLNETLINIRDLLFSPTPYSGISANPFSGHAIEYNMFTNPFASQPTQELLSMFTNPFAGQPTQELLSMFTNPFAGQPTQELLSMFNNPFAGQPIQELLSTFTNPFAGQPTQELLSTFTNPFAGQPTQELLSMFSDLFASQPTQKLSMFADPFSGQPTPEPGMFINPFCGQPTQELLSMFTDPFASQQTQKLSMFANPFSGQPTLEPGMFIDPFCGQSTQELGMFTDPFRGQSIQELSMLMNPLAGQPTQELGCPVEMPSYPPFVPIQDVGAPSVGWLDLPSTSVSNNLELDDFVLPHFLD